MPCQRGEIVSETFVSKALVSEQLAERMRSGDAAWRILQDAILQERYDKLPDLMSAMAFAEFAAEPIELIRDAIKRGDIVVAKDDGLVAIPKHANERLIRYRLGEDSSARVVERAGSGRAGKRADPARVRRLSTHIDPGVFELVDNLVARTGASLRDVVEEAIVARWGAPAAEGAR
jgi:hypothetical protein